MRPFRLSDGTAALLRGRWTIAVVLAALGVFARPIQSQAEDRAQLQQRGYVNDFGNFISESDSSRIGDICRTLDEHTGDRILVVTVESTGNLLPGQFGERLRGSWIGVTEVRERTLVIVVNGQGRIGFGIGSALESILTHETLDAALHGSLAVGGNDYGPKLIYLVQHIADDIEAAAGQAGKAPSLGKPSGTLPSASPSSGGTPASNSRNVPFGGLLATLAALLAFRLGRKRVIPTIFWIVANGALVVAVIWLFRHSQDFSEDTREWMTIGVGAAVVIACLALVYAIGRSLLAARRS